MNRSLRLCLLTLAVLLVGSLPVYAADDGEQSKVQAGEYVTYQNELYAYKLEVPGSFITLERPGEEGRVFVSPDNKAEIRVWGEESSGKTLEALYEDTVKRMEALGEIAYKKKLPDGFIVAWWSGDDSLYLRTIVAADRTVSMVFTCDEEKIDTYNGIAAHTDRTFKLLQR